MELEDTECEANRRKFNHQVGIVRDALNDTKGPPGWKVVGPFARMKNDLKDTKKSKNFCGVLPDSQTKDGTWKVPSFRQLLEHALQDPELLGRCPQDDSLIWIFDRRS
jgi:hypothetical protein